jgi:hypothetical protein
MSFVQRKINVTLSYGTGPDGSGTPKIVELKGHRTLCNIVTQGGVGMGQLQLRIFGLTPNLMADMSTIGRLPMTYARNQVLVYAGDDVNGMNLVYAGTVTAAYADMTGSPEVPFVIIGATGVYEALLPIPPTSWPGNTDVAIILESLAKQIGATFENHGVSVILRDAYFPGAARSQILKCIQAANISWNGLENNILAIWPRGKGREQSNIVISPETGMVGYPSYTATGIILTTEYNPSLVFGINVEVQSSLKQANGIWNVIQLSHELSAEYPGGPWFSQLQLSKLGSGQVVGH